MWGKRRPDRPASDPAAQQAAAGTGQGADSRPPACRDGARRTGVMLTLGFGTAVVAGITGLAVIATSQAGPSGHAKSVLDGMAHPAVGRAGAGAAQPGRATAGLKVESVTPSAGAAAASGVDPVQVTFSAPIAAHSAWPALVPSVHGQWQVSGRTLIFTPDLPLNPSTRFTLRIPAGQAGIQSAAGGELARPMTVRFRTAAYSQLRLAELLGQLGYLPMSWQSTAGGRLVGGMSASGLAAQQLMAYSPPPGSFSWRSGYPAMLHSQWRRGRSSPIVRGAVMAFQAQHGLAINGVAGRKVWHALFTAADQGARNKAGYTYAIASKGSPETLTIWHDGGMVLRTLANTGIPVAPTAAGTYPVYLRYRFQVMQGTNPDGSHYADPVSFVSYFDGGEAVHYFPRGSYGFEQSLGCVELPYSAAERAWPYLTYGSLVTVTG